jgi:GGDEF domain-containing protein
MTSADKVLARLHQGLHAHNASTSLPLSLSLGVARYDWEHPLSLKEMLTQADAEMYEQKGEKRIR